MIKFGTPTIALPLAIKKCTVQTGCTVLAVTLFSIILLRVCQTHVSEDGACCKIVFL